MCVCVSMVHSLFCVVYLWPSVFMVICAMWYDNWCAVVMHTVHYLVCL